MNDFELKFQLSEQDFREIHELLRIFMEKNLVLNGKGNSDSIILQRIEIAKNIGVIVNDVGKLRCVTHQNSRFIVNKENRDGFIVYVCEKCFNSNDILNMSEAYYCSKCGFVNSGPYISLDSYSCLICESPLIKH